jgi:hypothetical protein
MPKAVRTPVAHDYDPSILASNSGSNKNNPNAHSNLSSNIPHLNSWIEELVGLTESSLLKPTSLNPHPTTESLVQALQRYNAVYHELLRQLTIFSDPLAMVTTT